MKIFYDKGEPKKTLTLFGYSALTCIILSAGLTALIFLLFPEIDIQVARFFYLKDDHFLLRGSKIHSFFDSWIRPAWILLIIMFLGLSCLDLALRQRLLNWSPRSIAYVGLSYLIGPGLLVNGILKSYVGRVRPRDLMEFGGDKTFSEASPPIFGECVSNCSFVSGDVSFIMASLSLALLLSKPWRLWAVLLSLFLGLLISFYRISMGAHFLSDTLLAAQISIMVTLILYQLFFIRQWMWKNDAQSY